MIVATKQYRNGNYCYRLRVNAALSYHKGNTLPYFSVTGDIDRHHAHGGPWREDSCGRVHDEIERRFPGRFSDLIAMHLSDMDGAPMHFEGNGWYSLAGVLDGCGETYHAGNSKRNFPIIPDPATPWRNTENRLPTPRECLQIFADHCRISLAEAESIADECRAALGPVTESHALTPWTRSDYIRARNAWHAIAKTMLPRFADEAAACIARHNLRVEGDAWQAAA